MPRPKSPTLTDGELRLMRVLWHRGQATVGEVVDALDTDPKPAYNTVLTLLRIMEKKGYVTHRKDGRAFIFEPKIDREAGRVEVIGFWWEDGFAPRRADGFVDAMREALRAYLRFAKAEELRWAAHLTKEKRLFGTRP